MRKIMDVVIGSFCSEIIAVYLILDIIYKVPVSISLITLGLFILTIKKTIQNISI